jgi:hypothetical protein
MKTPIRAGVLTLALAVPLAGDVVIHEFLASNARAFPDIVDFEDYPDWVELKNTGSEAVSLGGWFLSDSGKDPYKWAFPAGTTIPAGGYLLVMADGYHAAPGERHPRDYWPWRNFTTQRLHSNFSLSAAGESLTLTRATETSGSVLVHSAVTRPGGGAVWRFLDNGSDPGADWSQPAFDDSAWKSGPSELGYGDTQSTLVSFGPSSSAKYPATFFRHRFSVSDPAAWQALTFHLLVDDGAVVFLNGQEIFRRNMTRGPVSHRSYATSTVDGSAESTFFPYHVRASLLVPGENVIAVQVHQVNASSSDISFDLAVTGHNHQGETVDSVVFGQQVTDVSMGRDPEEPGQWRYFATPSPGAENLGPQVADLRLPGLPVAISPPAGRVEGTVEAILSAAAGEIRYTLDGSNPGPQSPLYEGPLSIQATTVLRARCFVEGRPPGPIATRTWFVNEPERGLPLVSLAANPETLFGAQIGIYENQREPLVSSSTFSALGYRDVYKGKDAPGHVEFFAADGTRFRSDVGIRIGGENNWVHPQKALNLAVRGSYGGDDILCDLYPGRGARLHRALTLRDGGDRWANEMLRDCMWPKLAHGHMQVETSDYRPSVVFINGAYYGLHDLRERWDDTWFDQKFGLAEGEVDHLLYGHVTSSAVTLGVEKGDASDWLALLSFLDSADLGSEAVWNYLESRVDMESFMDFLIAESYGNNDSWRHNREFWKSRRAGGKWRWFLPDMDRTLSTGMTSGVLQEMLDREDLLIRLKASERFRQGLAQRYAAHMAGTFTTARVQGWMRALADEIPADEIARHAQRWSPHGMTASRRASGIQGTLDYAAIRSANVHAEIRTALGVPAAVEISLTPPDPAQGSLQVEGIPVSLATFRVFPGIPLTVTAVPEPGQVFLGWSGSSSATDATITFDPVGGESLTAHFGSAPGTLLGGTLTENTSLDSAGSPYHVAEDLVVPPDLRLEIGPGCELRFASGRNLRVQGSLVIEATASQPVLISGQAGERWGGVSFERPDAPSSLRHVILRDATHGHDPVTYPYAVSGLDADLSLAFLDIRECAGPVFCRGGSLLLTDSFLQTPVTGDCVNVKQGRAITRRCTFLGNRRPDTDAIDYDGVPDGIIEDCRIYRFLGPNSDAIDVGEGSSNLLIQRNRIFHCTDKGVSVGQGSNVVMRHNLIVACDLGVGLKDLGSHALIERNTFVRCGAGVSAYEKNFGDGGATAEIRHTIFSRTARNPVESDTFSTLTVSWSLSDSGALAGETNLLADPGFLDPVRYDFGLRPDSAARDAGDPLGEPDPDGSRADLGAGYTYDPLDYPFPLEQTVVIHEVLAHSGEEGDWIELHNRTREPIDLSGWFLSDDPDDPAKYRIPAGTVLAAGAFVVFHETRHFGSASLDPGKIRAFALSATGERVVLSSASDDELTDYQTSEDFGASALGETLGLYYKPSGDSWNFVAMSEATPGAPNSSPRSGPVVITEIHYNPPGSSDAEEYVELRNISTAPVTLAENGLPWRFTDGITCEFPSDPPITLQPGERMLVLRDPAAFTAAFGPPPGQWLTWQAGALDNAGETLQIGKPGPVGDVGNVRFIRVDRVNYDDAAPWPASPDGAGPALAKAAESEYGNDAANWWPSPPSPGLPSAAESLADWLSAAGVPAHLQGERDDPDGDGLPNLVEYALGTPPAQPGGNPPPFEITTENDSLRIQYRFRTEIGALNVSLESSATLAEGSWKTVPAAPLHGGDGRQERVALWPLPKQAGDRIFFRLSVQP